MRASLYLSLALAAVAAAPKAIANESPPAVAAAASKRPVRIGVQLGMLSLPRPADGEVLVRFYDLVGLGVRYSFLPRALSNALLEAASVHSASVDFSALEVELRLFPFQGAFFISGAAGKQSFGATDSNANATLALAIDSTYFAPRLGWLATWESGFALGFDLGIQVPLSVGIVTSGDRRVAPRLDEVAHQVANYLLPTLGLRAGWMF